MSKVDNISSRLRKRIVIQEAIDSTDGGGGFSTVWNEFITIWAEIKPFAGRNGGDEQFDFMQVRSESKFIITIRYVPGITTSMRILYNSQIFDIVSITNIDERNEILEIIAHIS